MTTSANDDAAIDDGTDEIVVAAATASLDEIATDDPEGSPGSSLPHPPTAAALSATTTMARGARNDGSMAVAR